MDLHALPTSRLVASIRSAGYNRRRRHRSCLYKEMPGHWVRKRNQGEVPNNASAATAAASMATRAIAIF